MHCSSCATRLKAIRHGKVVHYACPRCRGRFATLGMLSMFAGALQARRFWRSAAALPRRSDRDCPACRRTMEVVAAGDEGEVHLDICRTCRAAWADAGEIQALGTPASATPYVSPVRSKPLRMRIAEVGQRTSHWPDRWWKFLIAAFGVPVETDTGRFRRAPFVTWATVVLMVAVTAGTLPRLNEVLDGWGLTPAQLFRHGGLDWIASFFLHADPYHVASNAYFLLVFGDNVEEHLGHWRMLLLIVLAAFVGDLAHILGDPRSEVPLVGASGGISGVITLYALLLPRARLTIFVLILLPVTLPALSMLFLWAGLQFVGASQQLAGVSAVSAFAHIGGALVGLGFWWIGRHEWRLTTGDQGF